MVSGSSRVRSEPGHLSADDRTEHDERHDLNQVSRGQPFSPTVKGLGAAYPSQTDDEETDREGDPRAGAQIASDRVPGAETHRKIQGPASSHDLGTENRPLQTEVVEKNAQDQEADDENSARP